MNKHKRKLDGIKAFGLVVIAGLFLLCFPKRGLAQDAAQNQAVQETTVNSATTGGQESSPVVFTLEPGTLPPGMEYLQVSPGYREIVPQGTRLFKTGGALIPEGIRAYTGRRFQEIEKSLAALHEEVSLLKDQLEQLRRQLNAFLSLPEDSGQEPPQ